MSNISTVNPARALFRQRDDLQAFAAKAATKTYYEERNKRNPNPCNAMVHVIKDTVKHFMDRKSYPEKTIEAFQKSIADELIQKCDVNIFKVQELGNEVDDAMQARWRTYRGGKSRKSTRKSKNKKSKTRNNRR